MLGGWRDHPKVHDTPLRSGTATASVRVSCGLEAGLGGTARRARGRESVGIPRGIRKSTLPAAAVAAGFRGVGEKAGIRPVLEQEVVQGVAFLVLLVPCPQLPHSTLLKPCQTTAEDAVSRRVVAEHASQHHPLPVGPAKGRLFGAADVVAPQVEAPEPIAQRRIHQRPRAGRPDAAAPKPQLP